MSDLELDLDSEIDASFSEETDTEAVEKGSKENGKDKESDGSEEKPEGSEDGENSEGKEEKDGEGDTEKEKKSDPADKKDKPTRADKRIAELLQQRYKDRLEKEALMEKLSRFEKDGPEPPKKPSPDDFKFDPKDPESVKEAQRKFDYAMGKYEKELEDFEEKKESSKREQEEAEKKRIDGERSVYAAKIEEGKKQYADYDEAFANIENAFPITEALHFTLLDSKDPAGVLYHLGKNPDLAAKILSLPTTRQAIYLAKIDLNLKYAKDRKVKAASSAPAPAKKVEGSSGGKKDPKNMTAREWADFMAKQQKK